MAKPKRDSALPLSEVRQLIDLALARGLTELEVSQGETRIRIRREVGHAAAPVAPPPVAPAPAQQAERPEAHLLTIEAPMVGTFYRAPSPTADPYVREGDVIKEGQVLCVIEAMKLMNEIESKVAGRISKILVENGQPVEYGQPLFLIEPRA
ncbi:MAG: acetyl-CoA carboxylase biotin carboxyl carrier protein [Candidatus Rokubacteria bacterium]|nr:acetyl-CoA carboxylase biotin carboxyl carrier protein [Candidatus Rokubacteria bacterium]